MENSEPNERKHETSQGAHSSFRGVNRRFFLSSMGAAGVVATAGPIVAAAAAALPLKTSEDASNPIDGDMPQGAVPLSLRVNGQQVNVQLDPRTSLLDFLRESLKLTGTKKGCDHGQCGACTVHVNGRRINSCLSFAIMHEGDEITTIEGLGQPNALHPMQESFLKHDGYQCGYCTSGQIMSAVALLQEQCGPSDADVKELMSGNICRCGAYPNIVAAIQDIRKRS